MRLRLILSFALIVLVSVTGVVLIARQGAANEVRAFMFRGGMSGTQGLAGSLESYYQEHGSWQGVGSLLSSHGRGRGQGGSGGMGPGMGGMMNQRLVVADAAGVIQADSGNTAAGGRLTNAQIESSVVLQAGGQTVGYLWAEGGVTFSSVDESFLVERLTRAALIAGLIAGGLSLLLAFVLAYRLLRPVEALTEAAQQLGQGDLAQRVQVSGDDELALLGQTFNQMAASLQQAQESRKAMTADIAHELRNPLAVQLANLEALQDGIYPLTPESLQPILEQNQLLNRLVEDLRTLALAESGQLKLERLPTDLAALAGRMVERFRPQAESQGVSLQLAVETTPGTVLADPMRLEQILSNLLSNALRYTPQGGQVRLELARQAQQAQLVVADSGPGIPPEALAHIFERFYRADRSRSRAEGGTGLGLAIARQLAEAQGGTLSAANQPQGGAAFTLRLPLGG
ncbi:MAG: ATP-binding protein [Chloroflexota bacterium]